METTISGQVEAIDATPAMKKLFDPRFLLYFERFRIAVYSTNNYIDPRSNAQKAIDYNQIIADLMICFVQAGEIPHIRKAILESIQTINSRVGLTRYAEKDSLGKSLELVEDALAPIRNELLVKINTEIGPMLTK